TSNNPNIWYEVGYALANGKPVVLICAEPRPEPYPFDIRHRHIIGYELDSISDFETLKTEITARLRAKAKKVEALQTAAALSQVQTEAGLTSHEIAALVAIASNRLIPDSGIVPWEIKEDMHRSGYTSIAVSIAFESLKRKSMIEFYDKENWNGELFTACRLTSKGIDWLLVNQGRFRMTTDKNVEEQMLTELKDEDIPF